ncbi:MAG: DUF2235 domain-containing protein [candidate division Zixibacteria bacterium]
MSKNIVIFCDGTGNQYCKTKTNVSKLFEKIPNHTDEQIAYYNPGIGTLGSRVAVTRLGKLLTRLMGLAFAHGITRNIEDAYRFLMSTFEEEDKIFLFGFSRGAYTVRALAAMIMKCGLLYKGHENLIPYATKLYRSRKIETNDKMAIEFRETFSKQCVPHFIGVWDTVKSVGLYDRIKFSDRKLNAAIKYGYHALSVDEKRIKFRPVLWELPVEGQTIEQVWFAGVHSDVGGGYIEDGLSNIALKWMAQQADACDLTINMEEFNSIKLDYKDKIHNPLWPIWWILGWVWRSIAEKSNIHETVNKRMREIKKYRPQNLHFN